MRRSRSPRPGRESRARQAIGWLLAGVGVVCLLLTAAALALGARPLVVRTGSMAPRIPVGTVVLARPEAATEVGVGDVVAAVHPDGRRILHRVRRVRPSGHGAVTLVLRGDANDADDPPVTVTRVERPIFAVPTVGRPVTWLGGRWVQYWLGVVSGTLAVVGLTRLRRGRASSPETARVVSAG